MSTPVLSERVDKALREVSLTEYESQAYISLLHSGGDTAEGISQLSNIPYTKVYSVLENLEERGWVQHSGGRPRIYYPRSPTDALRSEQLGIERKFEYYKGIIIEELQPLFEKKDVKEIPELWIVRGEVNSFNMIIELLEKASKEIILAIPSLSEEIRFTYPDLTQMILSFRKKILDSSVAIKVLTTKEMKPLLEMSDLGIAEVRICDDLFGGGVVIDGKETILFLDLVHPHGPDTAIWSENETLTNVAKIYFEYLWKNAHPWSPQNIG